MMDRRPIILTAKMGDQDFAYTNRLRRQFYPAERNQVPAHITLFRHLPGHAEAEITGLMRDITAQLRAPKAMLADILKLSGGVALLVESEELRAIRAAIAEHFHGLLTQQDQGHPRMHITIQNKVKTDLAKQCYAAVLEGFQPRPLAIIGLQSHRYDGGAWEDLSAMRFRGKYGPFD
jgi:hypothetical protein